MNFLIIAGLFLGFNGSVFAEEHDHHKMHDATPGAKVKASDRFVSDANLKPRMEKVLNLMKTLHSSGNEKNSAKVKAAGKEIVQVVQEIFKTCKLEPKADAALHPILGEILKGAELFKKANFKDGHEHIHQGLVKYEEFFIHEGWDHKD